MRATLARSQLWRIFSEGFFSPSYHVRLYVWCEWCECWTDWFGSVQFSSVRVSRQSNMAHHSVRDSKWSSFWQQLVQNMSCDGAVLFTQSLSNNGLSSQSQQLLLAELKSESLTLSPERHCSGEKKVWRNGVCLCDFKDVFYYYRTAWQ